MGTSKSTFALLFGNRGFFPAHYMESARRELTSVLESLGHTVLIMPVERTRLGAVETPTEGRAFAEFFHENRRRIDGVILSLPNFGDENGVLEALREVDVPILIQAYPDELDKLGPDARRDSFCGKLSIMDVLTQGRVRFTNLIPHTVHPKSDAFEANVSEFDRICRVTKALRRLSVGAIGARTTPFKTVRVDEVALQNHGITVETTDLADVFARMDAVNTASKEFNKFKEELSELANWKNAPEDALNNLARLKVVLTALAGEMGLGTMALRCWTELQERYGISPCLVTGNLADLGTPVACEVDISNAITMYALGAASGEATSILDWNNNYGNDPNKCILFHCGNVPRSLMKEKGEVSDHAILANALGPGKGFGCNQGRMREMEFTYSSMITKDGTVQFYLGTGRITNDEINGPFFGCAGVAEIQGLQEVLLWLGKNGHRHHVSITPGNHVSPMREAFENYLGYQVKVFE
ncbi:MAG: L-fucose/L-arabinose isomerase family protein [Alkalispirochaetaceae bacterium]